MSAGPFGRLRGVALLAVGYGLAAAGWVVAGGSLPGGRWLAVHLFTLGVVTNLILALSDHFARTLTHQGGAVPAWQPIVVNVGIVATVWGIPQGERWVTAVGATVVTGVVLLSYVRLRRLRRASLGPRFGWVVRIYERAHGAFVHGAVLGALMATDVLAGSWYASGRLAHLHVNILGWGGLTLLATIVFFGPTMARIRIEDGADARAARALRRGATALTLAVVALLGTGIGGLGEQAFRAIAAVGLAVFAVAVTVVCLPVARAAWRAKTSAVRWPVIAVGAWFTALIWTDAVVVASGATRLLEALGLGVLLGVLAQAILAALSYLAPMLRGMGPARDTARSRLERFGRIRAAMWNLGVFLVVVAAAVGGPGGEATAWIGGAGWALVLGTLVAQGMLSVAGGISPRPAHMVVGDRGADGTGRGPRAGKDEGRPWVERESG